MVGKDHNYKNSTHVQRCSVQTPIMQDWKPCNQICKLHFFNFLNTYVQPKPFTFLIQVITKQNRESTEGYSKSIVQKNNDKFGKRIGLNK